MYHSIHYERPQKINNAVISYNMSSSRDNFDFISYFTCVNYQYYAIVAQLINVRPISSVQHAFVCNKVLGPVVMVPMCNH
jgi:hypothetical protein